MPAKCRAGLSAERHMKHCFCLFIVLLLAFSAQAITRQTVSNSPVVVNHYFDPLYEFQELGVTEGSKTAWKLMGPDLNGQYGSQNGTGGFEGVSPYLNLFYPTIADASGNILGIVTNSVVSWNSSRVTAYGAVPNYRPPTLGSSASLGSQYAYRDRAAESIGLVWLGANWYDPVDGQFMSADPLGFDANATLYEFCGGNPLGYWDADGRMGKMAWNINQSVEQLVNPIQQATHLMKQAWSDYWSAGGGIEGVNLAYNRNNPFTPLANLAYRENILTGEKFTWWGDYSENIGRFGLNMFAVVPVAQVARVSDVFTSQASTIIRETEMFNPGEMTPFGHAAGVGPGAQYAGDIPAGVQANKLAGDTVRDVIALREAPALTEQSFNTVGGIRRVDVLKLGDQLVGIESKVGRTALDSRVRQELARDWWLVRQNQLNSVSWEFTPSEVTGEVGPTQQLLQKLHKLGFNVRINSGQ